LAVLLLMLGVRVAALPADVAELVQARVPARVPRR
jgi:hypothetical protein